MNPGQNHVSDYATYRDFEAKVLKDEYSAV
jgi:hypothetical protein